MRRILELAMVLTLLGLALPGAALVNYDQGQRQIKGVQLLQDFVDPDAFYYVPQFPRLATKDDGTYELLCLKYVDPSGKGSGGLLHALIEFTLPEDVISELETELKKELPKARLVGPVPMMQAVQDGEAGMGSFQVVSSVLNSTGEGGFTRSVITSGKAPLTPGSKAVVSALLTPQGATLLWDSLTGPTSDVSVSIHGCYEAAVLGYNAKVTADVETVYEHFSRTENVQKGYTKRQLRNAIDELHRNGGLKVEVFDRTTSLGIKADELEGILQTVTAKLTEVMFDAQSGWSADPPREAAVEQNQIQGRQEKGWLARLFTGTGDQPYYTDDQWVLKKRQDIRQNSFTLTLAKNTTIKVPVDTAGNLGGLYAALGKDPRYFRTVNLRDPAFEVRTVHFQIDGNYADSFKDTVNFVSVNFRKVYEEQPAVTETLMFDHATVQAGKTMQDVSFPRLGAAGEDWTEYEYQVRWSLRDTPTISVPANPDEWLRGSDSAVSLVPPFQKSVVEVDCDRSLFRARGVATGAVEFYTVLMGTPRLSKRVTLRAADADAVSSVALYMDRESPVAYRASWYSPTRTVRGDLSELEGTYLYLVPPEPPEAAPE